LIHLVKFNWVGLLLSTCACWTRREHKLQRWCLFCVAANWNRFLM